MTSLASVSVQVKANWWLKPKTSLPSMIRRLVFAIAARIVILCGQVFVNQEVKVAQSLGVWNFVPANTKHKIIGNKCSFKLIDVSLSQRIQLYYYFYGNVLLGIVNNVCMEERRKK